MNHLLVAVASWYNFKLIWLDRFLVIKTIKLTIKLTPTREVTKQGTQAVVTIHNILISNEVNLHYLLWLLHLLQKTNDITSVQNIFFLPLHIKSTRRDRCFRTDETMKKEDGSLRIGSVHEDSWKKKWHLISFYMLNNR